MNSHSSQFRFKTQQFQHQNIDSLQHDTETQFINAVKCALPMTVLMNCIIWKDYIGWISKGAYIDEAS